MAGPCIRVLNRFCKFLPINHLPSMRRFQEKAFKRGGLILTPSLRWCSPANHSALSRPRPGFKSRPEHLFLFFLEGEFLFSKNSLGYFCFYGGPTLQCAN